MDVIHSTERRLAISPRWGGYSPLGCSPDIEPNFRTLLRGLPSYTKIATGYLSQQPLYRFRCVMSHIPMRMIIRAHLIAFARYWLFFSHSRAFHKSFQGVLRIRLCRFSEVRMEYAWIAVICPLAILAESLLHTIIFYLWKPRVFIWPDLDKNVDAALAEPPNKAGMGVAEEEGSPCDEVMSRRYHLWRAHYRGLSSNSMSSPTQTGCIFAARYTLP